MPLSSHNQLMPPWAMTLVNETIECLKKENGEIHALCDASLAAESRLDP
jgi:hypothetical protein